MKKLFLKMFSDRDIARMIDFMERTFVKSIAVTNAFALFKNGIMVPGSYFETQAPNPLTEEHRQLVGHAFVSVNPGDIIELRCQNTTAQLNSENVLANVGSMEVEKIS